MKKIYKITLGIFILAVIGYIILNLFGKNILLLSVPSNKNFTILQEISVDKIIGPDLGGRNYIQKSFDASDAEWLGMCYEAISVDDPEDVCRNFVRGYVRQYTTYTVGNQEIKPAEKEKYALVLYVLEYQKPFDVKSAVSFLTIDVSYPKINIDGIKVVGLRFDERAHYVIPIPSSNRLISAIGNSIAVEDSIKLIIQRYKGGL